MDPPNAGLLEVSVHYALKPDVKKCSMRQTWEGWEFKKLTKELKPGETITEEWTTGGMDLRSASFGGGYYDSGICFEPPGQYLVKLIAFFFPEGEYDENNVIVVESNEFPLTLK